MLDMQSDLVLLEIMLNNVRLYLYAYKFCLCPAVKLLSILLVAIDDSC